MGLELTKAYLADGDKVIAACRQPEKAEALRALPHQERLTLVSLDVKQEASIKQLTEKLAKTEIDILINNAGVMSSREEQFGAFTQGAWLDVLTVNTVAPVLVAQALVKQLEKSHIKIIANMSSRLGSIALNAEGQYDIYRASKAALNAATKSLAIALKPQSITVVALHPGWVQTDMGGEQAPVKPAQSVAGLKKVLNGLTMKDSGTLISFDEERLPW